MMALASVGSIFHVCFYIFFILKKHFHSFSFNSQMTFNLARKWNKPLFNIIIIIIIIISYISFIPFWAKFSYTYLYKKKKQQQPSFESYYQEINPSIIILIRFTFSFSLFKSFFSSFFSFQYVLLIIFHFCSHYFSNRFTFHSFFLIFVYFAPKYIYSFYFSIPIFEKKHIFTKTRS